jgi:hypothetical protein
MDVGKSVFDRVYNCLKFFDPISDDIVGQPYKDTLYKSITSEMSEILWNCYNATDVQFKLDDIIIDLCPQAESEIKRQHLYVIAAELWKIKENPEIK